MPNKAKKKQTPTVGLRCRKCGSTKVKVTRTQQMLRRTFRRAPEQRAYLHASVVCQNPHCGHEWWSAHETAIDVSRKLDEQNKDSEVVDSKKEA